MDGSDDVLPTPQIIYVVVAIGWAEVDTWLVKHGDSYHVTEEGGLYSL
jgi:hypothetical protein